VVPFVLCTRVRENRDRATLCCKVWTIFRGLVVPEMVEAFQRQLAPKGPVEIQRTHLLRGGLARVTPDAGEPLSGKDGERVDDEVFHELFARSCIRSSAARSLASTASISRSFSSRSVASATSRRSSR